MPWVVLVVLVVVVAYSFLLGLQSQWIDVAVAAVLLAAATVDVLSRRGASSKA